MGPAPVGAPCTVIHLVHARGTRAKKILSGTRVCVCVCVCVANAVTRPLLVRYSSVTLPLLFRYSSVALPQAHRLRYLCVSGARGAYGPDDAEEMLYYDGVPEVSVRHAEKCGCPRCKERRVHEASAKSAERIEQEQVD